MKLPNIKSSLIPPVIAHRGASAQAPENTLAAFIKAKQLGLNWVEFDVMLAATGEAIVIHDDDLERTTNGKGQIINCTYSYLKTLDAGSWFNPIFSTQCIPLLQEVLQVLHNHQLAANLEIKPLPGHEQATVQRVFEILKENSTQLPSPLLISSFSPIVLRLVRKISPFVLLGVLLNEWREDWQNLCTEVQCTSVNINQTLLTLDRVKQIKEKGYLLLAYTVNNIERAHELLSWGVDAIFSDCPHAILAGLKIKRNDSAPLTCHSREGGNPFRG
jgi:glycerophosphoryl diester phosphodiesterase